MQYPEELVGITHGDASEFLRQRMHETNEEDTEDEIENLIMAQVFENSIYAKTDNYFHSRSPDYESLPRL